MRLPLLDILPDSLLLENSMLESDISSYRDEYGSLCLEFIKNCGYYDYLNKEKEGVGTKHFFNNGSV